MKNVATISITAFTVILALIYGQSLLIPFFGALLLWIMVKGITSGINRIRIFREFVPRWIKTTISSILLIAALVFTSSLLSSSADQLKTSFPVYESNIHLLATEIEGYLSIDIKAFFQNNAQSINYGSILTKIINALSELLGSTFMVLIYVLFLFLEARNFSTKLHILFATNDKHQQVVEVLQKIEHSVSQYLGLKTLVSFITGLASYIALWFIGIDAPAFWAILIFILNFIPTIGSLTATIFPAVFCLLQFGSFGPGLMVLLIVGSIQVLVGNILEPRFMGNSLNISPMVAILSLSFWGLIWGVVGMILSIPITVIAIIICSQFPQTRSVAILLSENGNIKPK